MDEKRRVESEAQGWVAMELLSRLSEEIRRAGRISRHNQETLVRLTVIGGPCVQALVESLRREYNQSCNNAPERGGKEAS